MGFNTKECVWAETSVRILGRTLVGIQGFGFTKEFEKEALRGAGNEPIDIQEGDKKYEVNLDLLKYEVDGMNDAALAAGYEDITDVPSEAVVITCVYKQTSSSKIRTITANQVAFTKLPIEMKTGAKSTPVQLPGICMKIVNR